MLNVPGEGGLRSELRASKLKLSDYSTEGICSAKSDIILQTDQ